MTRSFVICTPLKNKILFVLLFLVGACRSHSLPADTVVILMEAPIGDIHPASAVTAHGLKISRLLHEPLVSLDSMDGTVRLELLEHLEQVDSLTAILHLKQEVRFSDGTLLTSRDVAFTLQNLKSGGSPFAGKWQDLVKVEPLDSHRVLLQFSRPRPTLLTDLDIGIMKAGHTGKIPVGAGSHVLAHRSTDRLELHRNPYYFKGLPPVSRLVFQTVEEENIRALLMSSGHADVAQNNISPILLPALRHIPFQHGPSWTLTYVGFNAQVPQLADPRVRKALALALDRDRLIRARFHGYARLARSVLPPGHVAHAPGPELPHDPAGAARLLDEAGYPVDPDTGIRFTLEYKTSSNPFRVALAKVIAGYWGKIGVQVRVRSLEWGVFFSDIKKRNFQVMSLQLPEIAVPDILWDFFHSSNIPSAQRPDGVNRWGYANPEVDRWLDETKQIEDLEMRLERFRHVQEKLMQDLPILPLWFEDNLVFLSRRVREYDLLPNARWTSLSRVVLIP